MRLRQLPGMQQMGAPLVPHLSISVHPAAPQHREAPHQLYSRPCSPGGCSGAGAALPAGAEGLSWELGLIPLFQELAWCCTAFLEDKFGTGGTKSQVKESRAEKRAAESVLLFSSLFSPPPLGTGHCYSPSPSPLSPVITVATCKQRQLQRLLALFWDVGPSQREPARGREKKNDVLREKDKPPCHLERDKLRCSKEDGREKERRTGLLQAIVGIKAFGEKERGIPCPPSA